MAPVLQFTLMGQELKKEMRFIGAKTETIDHATLAIQASIVATARDILVMMGTPILKTYELVRNTAGGDLFPFTITFDDDSVEECVAQISTPALKRAVWEVLPDSDKEMVRDHVAECTNEECPVNDLWPGEDDEGNPL